MTDHNRPTTDKTQNALLGIIPSWKDPVTPVTVGIFAIGAVGLLLLRRQAHYVTPVLLWLIAAIAAPCADWWEGRRRMVALSIVCGLAAIGLVLTWEADGAWLLAPLPLAWWVPYAIGRGRGSTKSNKAKVDHGLALIRQGLTPIIEKHTPPGTKFRKPKADTDGVVSIGIKLPSSSPRGAAPVGSDPAKSPEALASKIANDLGTKVGIVDVADCSRTIGAGEAVVKLRAATPFGKKLGDRPPLEQWPAGMVPVGEYGYGAVCYLGRHHMVVGAETGAGKTWFLENVVWSNLALGLSRLVILIDPKRVAFAKYRNCVGAIYAADPLQMLNALRQAESMMDARYRQLEAAGLDEWTEDMGPLVTVVIDETADLLGTIPDAGPILVRLYQLARASGIQVVAATQRPDAQSIPPLVKANAPTIVGLRVANATAERVLWEDAATRGARVNDRNLPAGRAWVETPGREGAWVQVYPTPKADGLRVMSAPSGRPTPPPPYAGETPPDTPPDGHPRTDTPDTQRPQYDDRIAELLDLRPLSARAVAQAVGCSPDTATKALKRLAQQGRAVVHNGGWIDPMFADDAA